MATAAEWLAVLSEGLEKRQGRIQRLRRYVDGNAPLPEMGQNLRASWEKFQGKSRTNWGGTVRDARARRIRFAGVTIDGSTATTEAQQLLRIVRDNRFKSVLKGCVRDALSVGVSYLVVGQGDDGRAVITHEPAEFVITEPDELQPWRATAALKVWVDRAKTTHATVWADGVRTSFVREYRERYSQPAPWVEVEAVAYNGPLPVYEIRNADGKGVVEDHTDLIDRINMGILWRLVTESIQAFRQRALMTKDGSGGLPEKDADGNEIDWARVFEPAPGALWEIPEQIGQVWESQQTDIRPMLDAHKDDVRELCAVTSTPIFILLPDSANQAATGAMAAMDALNAEATDLIDVLTPALEGVLLKALSVEGVADPGTVEVRFRPTELITLAERTDAASKLIAGNLAATRTIQQEILGWSPEQIAADEAERRKANAQALVGRIAATSQPVLPITSAS